MFFCLQAEGSSSFPLTLRTTQSKTKQDRLTVSCCSHHPVLSTPNPIRADLTARSPPTAHRAPNPQSGREACHSLPHLLDAAGIAALVPCIVSLASIDWDCSGMPDRPLARASLAQPSFISCRSTHRGAKSLSLPTESETDLRHDDFYHTASTFNPRTYNYTHLHKPT
jgi:hypothetical protein